MTHLTLRLLRAGELGLSDFCKHINIIVFSVKSQILGVLTQSIKPCGSKPKPESMYASIYLESNEPLNWLIENGGKNVRECLIN